MPTPEVHGAVALKTVTAATLATFITPDIIGIVLSSAIGTLFFLWFDSSSHALQYNIKRGLIAMAVSFVFAFGFAEIITLKLGVAESKAPVMMAFFISAFFEQLPKIFNRALSFITKKSEGKND